MRKPNWLKEYFVFNKADRIGTAVVIGLIGGILLYSHFTSKKVEATPLKENDLLVKALDTMQQRRMAKRDYDGERWTSNRSDYQPYERTETVPYTNGALFSFDPNTATAADWQRMGLNERTSKTIEKYVSKGGKFYKAEDLLKIWSMPEGFYGRVKDYATFESVKRSYPSNSYDSKPFVREVRKPMMVSINGGDTAAFIALPGIGSKLSARIVAFREKLGGFYSVEQVGETYGLPDSTFQKIKSRLQVDGEVRKINVNTATKDELKVHPYIRWNLANAIVQYRNQHGAFKSLEELKNIVLVDDKTFEKIRYYLNL